MSDFFENAPWFGQKTKRFWPLFEGSWLLPVRTNIDDVLCYHRYRGFPELLNDSSVLLPPQITARIGYYRIESSFEADETVVFSDALSGFLATGLQ